MGGFTIGQLAKKGGVHVETVRYYERNGLIPQPSRPMSGYRLYTWDSVRRLRFIRRAKELGFSLKQIRELLCLRVDLGTTCADVKRRAGAKISEIEKKIETLQRRKQGLMQLTSACRGRGPVSECPILEALEEESK